MALSIGKSAPKFKLASTDGTTLSSEQDLKGKSYILFFYPKDFTPTCTAEACEFRDQFEAFRELDIPVFGISKDTIETHLKFKKVHQLPFELLSDPDGKMCKAYDALIPLIKMPKRVTYLVNDTGKIAGVFSGMFESKEHIDAMIASLNKQTNPVK